MTVLGASSQERRSLCAYSRRDVEHCILCNYYMPVTYIVFFNVDETEAHWLHVYLHPAK